MHDALLSKLHPDIAGRWRSEQVSIRGSLFGPHQAMFAPPHHQHVELLMDDLVAS